MSNCQQKLLFLVILILVIPGTGFAKNILKDLIKVYTTYQQVNMLMWLSGDTKAEKRVGEETKWFINLTNKKVKDPEANRWVSSTFDRVKSQFRERGMDYNITVLEGNAVNAFALPGGNIFIYKGMLDMVNSDDELAAVLSHELAHAEKRHSLKQLRQSTAFQLLLQTAVKNKRDRDSWGQVVGALTMLKFSRQDEDEADDIGQKRMFAAGFNPAGQVTLWEKFVTKFGKGEAGILQYLSTHPPSQSRVDNARNNLGKFGAPPTRTFNLSYNILSDVEENLLQNSSFETDLSKKGFPEAWSIKEGKAQLSSKNAWTGKQSLELIADASIRQVRVLSEFIQIRPNEKYVVRGCVKSQDGTQRVSVGAELYDKSKRLRGFIWPLLSGTQIPTTWHAFEGTIESGKEVSKNLQPDSAFMKIILQSGPLSHGSIWFDDFQIRRGSSNPSKNLLSDGNFEYDSGNGIPKGISGSQNRISTDREKFKVGYASLRLTGGDGETSIEFPPIPVSELKEGQHLNGSFHHMGTNQIKGKIIINLIDSLGSKLARKVSDYDFSTKPNLWVATGFGGTFKVSGDERSQVKAISLEMKAVIPPQETLWVDGFILR